MEFSRLTPPTYNKNLLHMYLWLLDDESLISSHHKSKFIREKYPEIYKEFKSITFPEKVPFFQLFWHFVNDDLELKLGLCPICGNRCKFNFYKFKGYRKHCSEKCLRKDTEALYQSGIKAYNSMSDEKKISRINKIKSTILERYGVENYSQTSEFKDKVKNTWENKTQEEIDIIVQQRWCTNLEKYGKLNNGEKISKTLLSKDKEFWDERNEKIKNTSLERYNEEYYMKTDEYKQRIQDTWNNKSKEEIDDMVRKCKETTLKIYGFESYAQTSDFSKYHNKRVKYDGLTFDSSWEVIVYQYCKKYNKEFEYQPNVKLEYEYDNKKHYYQPDFLIDGQLYEVKGDQFFEGDKMINPYNRGQDELIESKYQCIIKNNVIILRGDDIKRIKEML